MRGWHEARMRARARRARAVVIRYDRQFESACVKSPNCYFCCPCKKYEVVYRLSNASVALHCVQCKAGALAAEITFLRV